MAVLNLSAIPFVFHLTAGNDGIYFTPLLPLDTALDEYVRDGDTDDDGEDDGYAVNAEA